LPCSTLLYRVVHIGKKDSNPQKVDEDCLNEIRHWLPLAPLHNKISLELIEHGLHKWPDCNHFVFSDSALFNTLPEYARVYPLPDELSKRWPVMKYGFHGLAHQSQWEQLQKQKRFKRVITIHLGGGSSLAAWQDGCVIDTTMGYTPTDGLPMTTRSGAIDPNIVLHLLEHGNYTLESLSKMFNSEAGLAGLSGISGDYRTLKQSQNADAVLARDVYSYALTKAIGSFMGVLGGVDAIAFGGGLGEHQPEVRESGLSRFAGLGISVSKEKNKHAEGCCAIHDTGSQTEIWVTPSDECKVMLNQYKTYTKENG
jgi:acetate kinase